MSNNNSNIEFAELRKELGIEKQPTDEQIKSSINNKNKNKNKNIEPMAIAEINTEPEEEIDIFANTDELITVTEKELIPEHERVYKDDTIYIEDLENDFLSELSINDQNNKFKQEQISEKVQKIISLKNQGQKILQRNAQYPPILDFYLNNEFSANWLIPIVLDKQKIYTTIDIEPEEEEEESISKKDIEEIDFRNQLEEYDKLLKDYTYKKISFEKFTRLSTELVRPFIILNTLDKKEIGYKTKLNFDTNLLRYFNINNSHWKERMGTSPIYISSDVLDEKKKIKATVKKIIVSGEEINIVGFFLLPKDKTSLTEIVSHGINRFDKIGNITSINKAAKTILTVKDHGLENGNYIVIKGNSEFDGQFKIHVIDKNKFTINYDTHKSLIDSNFKLGEIYGNMRLKYNTINIKKDSKNNYYLDNNVSIDYANLYLFDTLLLTKNDFIEILLLIVPTLNDIIVRQHIKLEKAKFMDDINIILMKYKTNYNDINIEQLDVIKNFLKKHIKEENDDVKKSQDEYNKYLKDRKIINKNIDFPDTIYANKYFYDKIIIDIYGEYPLKDNIFDSLQNRMIWLDHHNDFGDYYNNFVLNKWEIYNKKQIQESLKTVTNYHDLSEKTYEKEKKIDKYFDKCFKFVKEYKNKDELETDNKKYKDGDFAIVTGKKEKNINIHLDNSLIYKWFKDSWKFQEEGTEGDSLLYFCGLEGEKIKNLNSINCIYTLDGCKSKRLYKFEKQVDLTDFGIINYKDLLDNINNIDNVTKKKMLESKIKLNHKEIKKIVKSEEKIEFIEDKIPISIIQILSRITKVKNSYARRHLMFQLLDKDGLEINEVIYSKKYQGYLMCGHYIYLKREDYTNDNNIKEIVREKLLTRFGDDGKSIPGQQSCKVCGTYLGSVPYDDSPSFDDKGIPIIIRDEWVDEDKTVLLAQQKQAEKIICKSQVFRTDLINKGFKLEQLENGIKICEILQSVSGKIGIKLLKSDFINVTTDILEQYTILPSYPVFRKKSILLSKSKGITQNKILKLDQLGIYKISYIKFRLLKRYSLIGARLLIAIQTSIPPYEKKRPLTGCTFGSWQGKYGVEYLSCILQEMKVLRYNDINDKQKYITLEDTIDEIFKSIRIFNDKVTIKKLYGMRSVFDKSQPAKSIKKIDTVSIPIEVPPLDKNFKKKVLTSNDVDMLKGELYARTQYLGYAIKILIADVISKEDTISAVIGTENSCCIETLKDYSYKRYIDNHTDNKLKKLIEETWNIIDYFNLFINKGTVSKIYINPARIIYTFNKAIHQIITPELIKKKFETYCHIGPTKGELHYFIGKGKEERCVKCGEYLDKIRTTKYTEDNFKKLLDDIVKRNYIKLEFKEIIPLLEIDKLKKEDVSTEINNFIDRLAKLVGKHNDNIFKNKYKDLLNELGNYNNTYNTDKDEDSYQLIKLINNKEENRIQLLKNYINQYFRRYISIISNNYNIRDLTVKIPTMMSTQSHELQKFIYEDYDQLSQYNTETNAEIFKNLKFEYSIKDVDMIFGQSDKYNCEWDRIISSSKFNLKNATDVLLFILISQLNKFLLAEDPIPIANFIISMFDIILADDQIFDMSSKELEKYRTTIYHEQYCKYKRELATEGSIAETTFLQDQFGLAKDGTVDIQSMMDEDSKLIENNFIHDQQDIEIENLAKHNIGQEATPEQIEAFKETYYKNKKQEMYIYTDEFNMQQPKEDSFEILEVGDDYGLMPQGTENAGDGISVYSQSEWGE